MASLGKLSTPGISLHEAKRVTNNISNIKRGSVKSWVYKDRSYSLAKEVIKRLQDLKNRRTIKKSEDLKLRIKPPGIDKIIKALNHDRRQSLCLDVKKLEEIRDDLYSNMTPFSEQFSLSYVAQNVEETPSFDDDASEDPKKRFYSLCISTKIALGSKDPAQAVRISTFYATAMELNVLEEDWPAFIKSKLKPNQRSRDTINTQEAVQ